MATTTLEDLNNFLNTDDADSGFANPQFCRLIASIKLDDEDDLYKFFASVILSEDENENDDDKSPILHAARSYRAMTILKQDILLIGKQQSQVTIITQTRASLLTKDLLNGLSNCSSRPYSVLHIRTVLDVLLETYPAAVVSAAGSGGMAGMDEHLGPLMLTNTASELLPTLTHLVCYGCTGRKGIASAEKSAQHTNYQGLHPADHNANISHGHRRKFVNSMAEWGLLNKLVNCIVTSSNASIETLGIGEEACETILTILECIGYPPQHQGNAVTKTDTADESVGEDHLLAPLGTSEWWESLLGNLLVSSSTGARDEPTALFDNYNNNKPAIARVAYQIFALATGNSSRINRSHAPATDSTEPKIEEKLVEEEDDPMVKTNKLTSWGLTDKIHEALIQQIPLLIQLLDLPKDSMTFQATQSSMKENDYEDDVDEKKEEVVLVKHPGRYKTIPLSSWRHQLLMLFKEIVIYRSTGSGNGNGKNKHVKTRPSIKAMNAIMEHTQLPPEVEKKKKKGKGGAGDASGKSDNDAPAVKSGDDTTGDKIIYNPWPALCSLVFSYPHNDLYHTQFYQMFVTICIEHHEPTLRLVLQKSKFVTRAVQACDPSIATNSNNNTSSFLTNRGILLNCLNVLRLRRESLHPSCYLRQFLDSHDIWKGFQDKLMEITINQQTPIKGDPVTSIDLGSVYANELGLQGIVEWDGSSPPPVDAETNASEEVTKAAEDGEEQEKTTTGKKKKKNKKKKKK